ncbi:MAG: carbohydrate binding family 9 domain-containing protein [candidate division Zixibacteria bacterium]|nr:carbohydrate binding family 9 domain-containing protein [candidate division Zixibacteria bacterium]
MNIWKYLTVGFSVVAFSYPVLAQERIDLSKIDRSKYRIEMVKVETGPKIDGVMDDAVWSNSPVVTGVVQFSPEYLVPATEETEVRVLYDDENLYVGAICFDREPEKVVAREMRRDANIFTTDDTFAFTLSPVADGSVLILFNTSPLGEQRDVYGGNFGETFNDSWDTVWRTRARRNERGWAVEIAVPFKALRFEAADVQDWTIIFRRQIRRKRETSYWPQLDRAYGFATMYKMQQAGKLVGLEKVSPGRALEILPYTTLGATGLRRVPPGLPLDLNASSLDFNDRKNIGSD